MEEPAGSGLSSLIDSTYLCFNISVFSALSQMNRRAKVIRYMNQSCEGLQMLKEIVASANTYETVAEAGI